MPPDSDRPSADDHAAGVVARHWRPEDSGVHCLLCPHECLIAPGRRGRCLGRVNHDNRLIAASYGRLVSVAVDPIEKKPLYHFHPGKSILSVATYGCNLNCPFCQNRELARRELPGRFTTPAALVELARRSGTFGVAFTYSEPLVWFEYLVDSCAELRAAGFKTVLVTNGMINPEPLEELLPHVDAMNVDIKSLRPEFYRDYVGGSLSAVQHTIRTARPRCHVELTNLVIPGRNDADADIEALADFVAGLGRDTVLHLSRYFPHNRAEEPATPRSTLVRAAAIARQKLDFVYLGNA